MYFLCIVNEETDNPNDIEMISPSINSPSFEEQPLPPLEEDKVQDMTLCYHFSPLGINITTCFIITKTNSYGSDIRSQWKHIR